MPKTPLHELPSAIVRRDGKPLTVAQLKQVFQGGGAWFWEALEKIAAEEHEHSTGTLPSSQGEFLSCEETVIPETHLSDSYPA